MSTSRSQELWHHGETGEAYIVELEDDRVISANGPLTEDQLSDEARAYKQVAEARTPAYTEEAADLDRRRDEFERERLEPPG